MKSMPLLVMTVLAGVWVVSAVAAAATDRGSSENPPQLWSDHKQLEVPLSVCADRAFDVLNALGYSQVVRNGSFSYGTFGENRAAVKCVENDSGSFVYFAVAGPRKETVERLRNEIAWKL